MGEHSRIVTEDGYTASSIWGSSGAETKHGLTPTLAALLGGKHVVYAIRLKDGIVKIGCTKNLANRSFGLQGKILAFRLGGFGDEMDIHAKLAAHRARGCEYYHPTPEVLAVVNDMRDDFNLPHIAA